MKYQVVGRVIAKIKNDQIYKIMNLKFQSNL